MEEEFNKEDAMKKKAEIAHRLHTKKLEVGELKNR